MADAHADWDYADDRAAFTVAPTAIPPAVQCRGCGRHLLPARLWPIAIRPTDSGRTAVELRCVRCHATGTLVLDPNDADHRALLALWNEQRTRSNEAT